MLIMNRLKRSLAAVVMAVGIVSVAAVTAAAVEGNTKCQEGPNRSSATISSSCPSGGGASGGSTEEKDRSGGSADEEESSGSGGGSTGGESGDGGAGYKKFGSDEEHPEAPDSWARAAGEGSQGLADYTEQEWLSQHGLWPKWGFNEGFFTLYSVMEAIGWVLAIVAIFLASRRMASGDLEGRTVFARAFLRFLLLTPIFMAVPLAVAWIHNLGWSMAGGFLEMAGQELSTQLDWVVGFFAVGTIAALAIPGGSAVIVGIGMFLIAALGALILELIAAHFLVYALTIVLPVLIGASVNPAWRGGVRKATGALLAAMLAPAAMTLVWAISFSVITPQMSGHSDSLTRLAILIAGICLGIAAPAAAGMMLGYIMPAFNLGGAGREQAMLTGATRNAVDSGKHRGPGSSGGGSDVSSSLNKAETEKPGQGSGGDRGRAAANVTDADAKAGAVRGEGAAAAAGEGSAGGGAAGAAGGAAAAGPAAAVVAAAKIWDGIRRKTQDAAGEVTRRVAGAEQNAEAQGGSDLGSVETDSAALSEDADVWPDDTATAADEPGTGPNAVATNPAVSKADSQAPNARADDGGSTGQAEAGAVSSDGEPGRQGLESGGGVSTTAARHPGIAAGAGVAGGAAAGSGAVESRRRGRGPDFVGPQNRESTPADSRTPPAGRYEDDDPLNPPPYVGSPRDDRADGAWHWSSWADDLGGDESWREPAVVDEGVDQPLAYQNAQEYQDQPYEAGPADVASEQEAPADGALSEEADSWGRRQDFGGTSGSWSERGGR